jgi:hypothetical protein
MSSTASAFQQLPDASDFRPFRIANDCTKNAARAVAGLTIPSAEVARGSVFILPLLR